MPDEKLIDDTTRILRRIEDQTGALKARWKMWADSSEAAAHPDAPKGASAVAGMLRALEDLTASVRHAIRGREHNV